MAQRPSVHHGSADVKLTETPLPNDAEGSLDELSRAYAVLLAKGGIGSVGDATVDDDHLAGEADEAFEVTPRAILEAILFVGHPTGEPLTSERIAGLMRGVEAAEIDAFVDTLNAEYATAAAPYSIVRVDAGYQMILRPEFGPLRDVFYGRVREARLSQAAIEVLAIVAYHQPIAADEINRLRGKPSGAIVAQLVRRELLAVVLSADRKAPSQYQTTSRFLDLFGLGDLKELPTRLEVDRNL
jgi:segregation and condensation protein B